MVEIEWDKLFRSQPFEAFEIHLSGGRSYVVEHPDFAMRTKDNQTLHIAVDDSGQTERIRMDAIISVTTPSLRRPRKRKSKA